MRKVATLASTAVLLVLICPSSSQADPAQRPWTVHRYPIQPPLEIDLHPVVDFFSAVVWNEAMAAQAAQRAAAEKARPKIAVDVARWQRLNVCEEGGSWYNDGYNPADPGHQHFVGGLGMSTEAWRMAVEAAANYGVNLPGWANSATPMQQMTGAQAFYNKYGWGWACHV